MFHNLDTIYYKPDLVRISQPKLISARKFIDLQRYHTILSFTKKKNWSVHCTIPTWAYVGSLHIGTDILGTGWLVTKREPYQLPSLPTSSGLHHKGIMSLVEH